MFVKPAPGRIVRDPVKGTPLPENGAEVPNDAYFWLNRLRDGDVEKVEQEPDADDASEALADVASTAAVVAAPKGKTKKEPEA